MIVTRSRRVLATTAGLLVLGVAASSCAKGADVAIGSSKAEMDSDGKGAGKATDSSTTPTSASKGPTAGGKVGKIQPAATAKFVQESAQRTREANSMKMAMSMDGMPQAQNFTMDMAVDVKKNLMSLNMDAAGQKIEMIVDGATAYMKLAGLGDLGSLGGLGGGKDWIKFTDPEMIKSFTGGQGGFGAGMNAKGFLDGFLGAGGTVEDLGMEDVRGVPTHHYKGTISASAAAASSGSTLTPEEKKQMEASLGKMGDIPVEVWIDDDGLMRKMKMSMDGSAYGASGSIGLVMELYDVGQPVEIKVPSPDKVMDLGALGDLGGLGGGTPKKTPTTTAAA